MTTGDRVMSPKKIALVPYIPTIHRFYAGIELRDTILAAATLSNAPKHFKPRVPGASINDTADWRQNCLRFGAVERLHSVVRQGMPSPCSLC